MNEKLTANDWISNWLPRETSRLSDDLRSRCGLAPDIAEELSQIVGGILLASVHPEMWDGEPRLCCDDAGWLLLGRRNSTHCANGAIILCAETPSRRYAVPLRRGLETIGEHLAACQRITKLGVVVTDVYRPNDFKWNEHLLRTAEQRGQQLITILKTQETLNVICLPWN